MASLARERLGGIEAAVAAKPNSRNRSGKASRTDSSSSITATSLLGSFSLISASRTQAVVAARSCAWGQLRRSGSILAFH